MSSSSILPKHWTGLHLKDCWGLTLVCKGKSFVVVCSSAGYYATKSNGFKGWSRENFGLLVLPSYLREFGEFAFGWAALLWILGEPSYFW